MAKRQVWQCQRCGHKTFTEPGEKILAEFLCLEDRGRCLGIVRQLLGVALPARIASSGGSEHG
jgi:hypothetical protein